MACGRCGGALEPEQLGEGAAASCAGCGGIALKQAALIPALHFLAKAFSKDMTWDTELPRAEPPAHTVACRACGQGMTAFGYMETRMCYAHRCSKCWEVWLDAEQLPAIVLLYARTNFRREAREQAADEEAEGMSRRLRAQLAGRLQANAIAFGGGLLS